MIECPPGAILLLGGMLAIFFRGAARYIAVVASTMSMAALWIAPMTSWEWSSLGLPLQLVRVDQYSFPFAVIFHIAAVIASVYAMHVRDWMQHAAGMIYAAAAIGAACAGDLVTLFVYWELTAVSSVLLIWARRTEAARAAGMRYLIVQVASGVLLLTGAVMQYSSTGSITFNNFLIDGEPSPAGWLVLAAFGIKAAFPLLHNWLQDSYPQATATGTVYLSAFTTKLAIYALIRGFAGFEPLIVVGCIMTLFPIVFAVIENDLRRVLAYSLNNQLGFMVVGVGIGTELAINGTVAHAFCHIIYKSLLFMSMGAVLHRVGTTRATELGGLYKSMPWTTAFCIIGAASIAGFPLLSGFVSKSMIITAAAEEHLIGVWIVLLIASAGVMEHSGIKIPFFAFFGHDSGKRVREAPLNMLLAMGGAAALCIGLGLAYPMLYRILPFAETLHYLPYTTAHVINQLQLLAFAALAFLVLWKTGLYPEEKRAINLDIDVVYRRWIPAWWSNTRDIVSRMDTAWRNDATSTLNELIEGLRGSFGPAGVWGRTWSSSTMAFYASLLLAVCLLLYYSG